MELLFTQEDPELNFWMFRNEGGAGAVDSTPGPAGPERPQAAEDAGVVAGQACGSPSRSAARPLSCPRRRALPPALPRCAQSPLGWLQRRRPDGPLPLTAAAELREEGQGEKFMPELLESPFPCSVAPPARQTKSSLSVPASETARYRGNSGLCFARDVRSSCPWRALRSSMKGMWDLGSWECSYCL
jgi:hypothetical protein